MNALAGYASSSDDSGGDGEAGPSKRRKVSPTPKRAPAPKLADAARRKPPPPRLPTLPSSFGSTHDDPAAHQGRRRARPFADGDYYAHIYAELPVPPALARAIAATVADLQRQLPAYTVHSLLDADAESDAGPALHVSLSHPLPLRRGLVHALAPELRAALGRLHVGDLTLSLAALAGYANTAGRAFAALRVGAGAGQLARVLDDAVAPVLARHHLPAYHADAEFHASFAWCLQAAEDGEGGDAAPFTPALLAALGETHTRALLKAQPAAGWTVSALCVKVARDVTRIPL